MRVLLSVLFALSLALSVTSKRASASVNGTRIGMAYFVWHCLTGGRNYDISEALAGRQPWGPVGTFQWWSRPSAGYYCPLSDRAVVRHHAELLRDAGIDFVFVDLTNFTRPEGQALPGGLDPLQVVLEEWSTVNGAPKIVPWLPLAKGATLPDAVDRKLAAFPHLLFFFRGKPLLLHAANPIFPLDAALAARFAARYTLRSMWANPKDPTTWSFMEACQGNFKGSGGAAACNQRVAYGPDGRVEQVSVTTAYQRTYMSDTTTAVPKFRGRTFQAQMKRLDTLANPPIATITGWNEWIATRFCVRGGLPVVDCTGASDHLPNGNPVFVDEFDVEYDRDLEPGGATGDFYYRLLQNEVLGRKRASSQIIGHVDAVSAGTQGVLISGWACSTALADGVAVHVYAGGPAGSGRLVAAGAANLASEPAVGDACGDGGRGGHRFAVRLDPVTARAVAGKAVYVHGISPVAGHANLAISGSGVLRLP